MLQRLVAVYKSAQQDFLGLLVGMSFVSDAGSRRSSAFCATSVWPLVTSVTSHPEAAALGAGMAGAGACDCAVAVDAVTSATAIRALRRKPSMNDAQESAPL